MGVQAVPRFWSLLFVLRMDLPTCPAKDRNKQIVRTAGEETGMYNEQTLWVGRGVAAHSKAKEARGTSGTLPGPQPKNSRDVIGQALRHLTTEARISEISSPFPSMIAITVTTSSLFGGKSNMSLVQSPCMIWGDRRV